MGKRACLFIVLALEAAAFSHAAAPQAVFDIGSRRELFCDGLLVDSRSTTATRVLHHPHFVDTVMTQDAPWEGNSCSYGAIVQHAGKYCLYYVALAYDMVKKKAGPVRICYAESKDGVRWNRPDLGRCEYGGSKHNNVLLGWEFCSSLDNFVVFKDTNPDCPSEELFKMLVEYTPTGNQDDKGLWLMTSPNPTDFKLAYEIVHRGNWNEAMKNEGLLIDTQSTACWDAERKVYHLYTRGYHCRADDRNGDTTIRDIRHATSKDFKTWSQFEFLDFGPEAEDYSLYTNLVRPYERAPHLFVGFPTRYVERRTWSPSFDKLPGVEARRLKMRANPRYGLAITDAVFMFSRDGFHFKRYDEAFISPGPEDEINWIYGDCYPYYGALTLPSAKGRDLEMAFLIWERDYPGGRTLLNRYHLRLDGFVSYFGTYRPQHLVTRKIRYSGDRLLLNFATSARGYIRLRMKEDLTGREAVSAEIFGDATDRDIAFVTGSVSEFAGKPVTLDFELSDAHVYSFKFD